MSCTLPFSENNSKDIKIECNFDTQIFPLIWRNRIIFPMIFPKVQGYSIANSDFNNKELYIDYSHPSYSLIFRADEYINATCYKICINVFSAIGRIINGSECSSDNNIYIFNSFMIIDDKHSNVSCKIYKITYTSVDFQLDCYTNGTTNVKLFNTISKDQNMQKNILIDWYHGYLLQKCIEPVKKIIDFQANDFPKCFNSLNKIYLSLTFFAKVLGFLEEKSISVNLDFPSYYLMNCIVPASRNGETRSKIKCTINASLFPLVNNYNLPKEFPKIEDIEILNWDKIDYKYLPQCYQKYQLTFSNFTSFEQNCKTKKENMISFLGSLKDEDSNPILNKTIYSFTLSGLINKELKNISCELYPSDKNQDYYRMDCNIFVNNTLEFNLYEIIVNDELSNKSIYIIGNDSYQISECSKNNKFINFEGKIDMKSNLEKSLFELDIYSETIGFEEEKKIQFNLDYPKYSKMDCIIRSSNVSNNNTFIKCTMDMNKYPLIEGDYFILPNNIFDKENCSLTKWDKIKKTININKSCVEYSTLYSPYGPPKIYYYINCDDKGNNIIDMYGPVETSSGGKDYYFNISGIVDDELKNIPCNLIFKGGKNYNLRCFANGNNSAQIFQTKGVNPETKEVVLIKIKDYYNYPLKYCSVSKTKLILAIVLPIVGAIIIIVSVILIIRYKRKHSNNTKEEVEKLENMKLIN